MNLLMLLFWAVIKEEDVYSKKIKRLAEQYRLTSQLKFIEHCKNMPLAYKVSRFGGFSFNRTRGIWKSCC